MTMASAGVNPSTGLGTSAALEVSADSPSTGFGASVFVAVSMGFVGSTGAASTGLEVSTGLDDSSTGFEASTGLSVVFFDDLPFRKPLSLFLRSAIAFGAIKH